MSIHKDFYAHGASIKINIDEGDGLFAAKIGQAIPEFADTQYAEVLIELTCGPKISFLGLNDDGSDRLMFDGGEADLQMSMYWKVRTSLFLHSQLRRWHCWCMCIGRCVLKYNITRKLTFLRPNHPSYDSPNQVYASTKTLCNSPSDTGTHTLWTLPAAANIHPKNSALSTIADCTST